MIYLLILFFYFLIYLRGPSDLSLDVLPQAPQDNRRATAPTLRLNRTHRVCVWINYI